MAQEQSFEGIYLNGMSSVPWRAAIVLAPGAIRIAIADENETPHLVDWPIEQIHRNEFNDRAHVRLKFGASPAQHLEVQGQGFYDALEAAYPQAAFRQSTYSFIQKYGKRGIFGVAMAIFGFIALLYFVILPYGADSFARLLPRSWVDKKIGEGGYQSMTTEYRVDAHKTALLGEFVKKLKLPGNKLDLDIQPVVVKSEVINAFALPDGHIFVFDSIIRSMKTYPELVALLGHEYAHVRYRHSVRLLARSMGSNFFIMAMGGGNVMSSANSLNTLGYSRGFEADADEGSFEMLAENRLDPNGANLLFTRLKNASPSGGFELLSDHPETERRIKHAKEEAAKQHYRIVPRPDLEALFDSLKAR